VQLGYTPLHGAAMGGHAECVTLLVDRGANKEATNNVRCARSALRVSIFD
jgi:ankyrin repeat protein